METNSNSKSLFISKLNKINKANYQGVEYVAWDEENYPGVEFVAYDKENTDEALENDEYDKKNDEYDKKNNEIDMTEKHFKININVYT